jgi:competence protein ComEA
MGLVRLFVTAVLATGLALPAVAQTVQTSPAKPASPSISTTPSTSSSSLVDINSASLADLDALPGIGKARAAAIIKNRPYKGKDDLLSRHIIAPNIYKGIANKIIARQS